MLNLKNMVKNAQAEFVNRVGVEVPEAMIVSIFEITLPVEMLLKEALQYIMDAYADTVTFPRFYFVESVLVKGGIVEVHFGT